MKVHKKRNKKCKPIDNKNGTNSRLTLLEKLDIIRQHEEGLTVMKLARKFNVYHSSIRYILKQKDKILESKQVLLEQNGNLNKVNICGIENSQLEICLYEWFLQRRRLGAPVNGNILKQKALFFNEKLGGPSSFRASDGWCCRFKKRHGIRFLSEKGDRLSDVVESSQFSDHLQKIIKEKKVNLENVYNAYETSLAYKSLPTRNFVSSDEKEAAECIIAEDRITALVCANTTGSHKIPILVIGKYKEPKCSKNGHKLPLPYKAQSNAWMDKNLFLEWYKEIFLVEIKARINKGGKCLLIIDNVPSHPSLTQLNDIDPICETIYIPPNTSCFIQPMDQGVISSLKGRYRSNLLQHLVFNVNGNVENFLKGWTILDCIKCLSYVWNSIQQDLIKNAWNKLWNLYEDNSSLIERKDKILFLANNISDEIQYNEQDIDNWLSSDNWYPTFYIKTDEEIINCGDKDVPIVDIFEEEPQKKVENESVTHNEAISACASLHNYIMNRKNMYDICYDALQNLESAVIDEILNQNHSEIKLSN